MSQSRKYVLVLMLLMLVLTILLGKFWTASTIAYFVIVVPIWLIACFITLLIDNEENR